MLSYGFKPADTWKLVSSFARAPREYERVILTIQSKWRLVANLTKINGL